MATWEDGPEYAPLARPAEFTSPSATPLEDPPVPVAPSAGAPSHQPRFDAPAAAVAPLATLVPADGRPHRDPEQAFEVVSATLTPDPELPTAPTAPAPAGAWGAAHWSPLPAGAAPAPGPWGPPGGSPWPAPTQPFAAGPPPVPGAFPSPGTAQWFGPGQAAPAATGGSADVKAVAAALTPGVLITLAIGLVPVLAPFTLCVALFLTTRMQVARQVVQRVFLGALAFLALVAVIAALTNLGTFSDWWSTVSRWALFLSVVVAVVSSLLVRRELLRGPRWS